MQGLDLRTGVLGGGRKRDANQLVSLMRRRVRVGEVLKDEVGGGLRWRVGVLDVAGVHENQGL